MVGPVMKLEKVGGIVGIQPKVINLHKVSRIIRIDKGGDI